MNIVIGKTSGFCNGVSNTIKKAEEVEKDKDSYCEFMKGMILNTYSAN